MSKNSYGFSEWTQCPAPSICSMAAFGKSRRISGYADGLLQQNTLQLWEKWLISSATFHISLIYNWATKGIYQTNRVKMCLSFNFKQGQTAETSKTSACFKPYVIWFTCWFTALLALGGTHNCVFHCQSEWLGSTFPIKQCHFRRVSF